MSQVAGRFIRVGLAGTHFCRPAFVHPRSYTSWSHWPLVLHCDLGAGVHCVLNWNRRNTFWVGNVGKRVLSILKRISVAKVWNWLNCLRVLHRGRTLRSRQSKDSSTETWTHMTTSNGLTFFRIIYNIPPVIVIAGKWLSPNLRRVWHLVNASLNIVWKFFCRNCHNARLKTLPLRDSPTANTVVACTVTHGHTAQFNQFCVTEAWTTV